MNQPSVCMSSSSRSCQSSDVSGIVDFHHGGPVGHMRVVGVFEGLVQQVAADGDGAAFHAPFVEIAADVGTGENVVNGGNRHGSVGGVVVAYLKAAWRLRA